MDQNTPLKACKLAVIDTETTGLDAVTGRICDIAVIHYDLGSDVVPEVAFSSLVNPLIPIPEEVSRIHGITDAMVADRPAWPAIEQAVFDAIDGRLVVAFNAPFDFQFVREEVKRHGSGRVLPWPWLCLQVVRKATITRGAPGRLAEIASQHGIKLDAHGAAGDALTTAMLATPLMRAAWSARAFWSEGGARAMQFVPDDDAEDYEEDQPTVDTVGALLEWQGRAALFQERDFALYAQRQGWVRPPRCPWHELAGVPSPTWEAPVRTRITKDGRVP